MFYIKSAVISVVLAYVVLFAWAIVTFLRTRFPLAGCSTGLAMEEVFTATVK
jgi:hypothetical protein